MDRQSLLEQKRQRLQELKQRRLGTTTSNDDKLVNELIDQFQTLPSQRNSKQVNVAIQVDIAPQEYENSYKNNDTPIHINNPVKSGNEIITYDKAIQAVEEPSDIESESKSTDVEEINDDNEEIESEYVAEIEESKLNASMKQSFKFLNKIIVQEALDSSILKNYTDDDLNNKFAKTIINEVSNSDPFQLILDIPDIKGRLVKDIDISPHYPELIVASYLLESSSINHLISNSVYSNSVIQSPGLAIIYNIRSSKAFPEYFLHCSSSITIIKFDKLNPHKVIGGLSDGKVVIWNLLDNRRNSVALLPLLMTPILSNIASSRINKNQQTVNFIHHMNEISSINQIQVENNECIISTSIDGVINLWSSNLLAWPKISSLKLTKPTNNTETYVKPKEILTISNALILQEKSDLARSARKELSSQPTAYKFLNRLLVGSNDGKLFKLSNDPHNGHIEFMYEENYSEDEGALHSNSITSIIELPIEGLETIIATSNVDWTIKIWKSNQKSPLLQIPTNYLILDMKSRPSNPFQFLTLGVFNHGLSPIIDFWDISRKLMNPICSILLDSKIENDTNNINRELYSTSAKFLDNGEKIIIGFNDGSIQIWSINDVILNEVIESRTNSNIDDGLIVFLQRSKKI